MNQGNERTTSMSKTKGLVQMAIFAALIVVLAFTPFIGYIPLGFTRATIIHIPVIMVRRVLLIYEVMHQHQC